MTAQMKTIEAPSRTAHARADAAANAPQGQTPLFVVEPARRSMFGDVKEIWAHRELLLFLSWRDVKVRYKQTALGALWAVLQPFMTMVVFTVFFGELAGLPSDGTHYSLFSYAALLPWHLFTSCLGGSARSLVRETSLITKTYFPRLILPLSTVFVALLDFAAAFTLLVAMMAYYGIAPTLGGIAFLPLFTLLALTAALAFGLCLAALNVRYRDVQYALPFVTQLWLFITPVAYPLSLVPAEWRTLYSLNPMVGVVEGFRWALLPEGGQPDAAIFISMLVSGIVLAVGLLYFRRSEASFADLA